MSNLDLADGPITTFEPENETNKMSVVRSCCRFTQRERAQILFEACEAQFKESYEILLEKKSYITYKSLRDGKGGWKRTKVEFLYTVQVATIIKKHLMQNHLVLAESKASNQADLFYNLFKTAYNQQIKI
jgi:hypothetical protein